MTATVNFYAAWIAILLGLISGTIQGLFFADENWLGGYSSWPRRMLRLGHISFFGLPLLDLALIMSADHLKLTEADMLWTERLMIGAMICMPSICYLSAYKKHFKNLFFIPVIFAIASVSIFIYKVGSR